MSNDQSYLQKLDLSNPLRERVIRTAIEALQLPKGSRGLDAGCGIGHQALLLAEAVGPHGRVMGLDVSTEFLQYAEQITNEAGLSKRVSYQDGNINHLPFEENTFDWVWSMDCAGYAPGDPLSVVKELSRIVRPGGTIALIAWSSEKLLPGYPLLEAKLNATSAGIEPFRKGMRPENHFLRMMYWFLEAGLVEIKAQTFAGTVHAPLDDKIRAALISLMDMRWPNMRSELSPDNWQKFQRLCQPDSPDFIVNIPDYYAFFTYSMFQGKVPE